MNSFLEKVARVSDSKLEDDDGKVYLSLVDDSYVGRVGLEKHTNFKFLEEHGIGQLQSPTGEVACIGFSEKEQKWYGWSHRAIYGFGIGSETKKGDCSYTPTDKEDFLEDMVRFWTQDDHLNVEGRHGTNQRGEHGVFVDWVYSDTVPNKKIRGTNGSSFHQYPETYGCGEWTAKTLEDAKQMACDFAEGVG